MTIGSLPEFGVATAGVLCAAGGTIALHAAAARVRPPHGERRPRLGLLARAVYLAMLACVGVLAATAFVGVLAVGSLGHWLLLAHVGAGGVFAVLLGLLALAWSAPCRPGPGRRRFGPWTKVTFWLVLVAGAAAAATAMSGMVPVFGTGIMLELLEAHRFAGLALVAAAALHAYLLAVERLRR